jgi:pimeloyl-ACP methyl ester carboxylesterase
MTITSRVTASFAVAATMTFCCAGTSNAAPTPVTGQESTSPSGAHCREYRFPVRIGTANHAVYGELCGRGRLTSRTPVQVLLHGGTYDHSYWDWPFQPRRYSYVDHATRAGYATLNIDRLGYGRSSRPDPTSLDFAVGGDAVHQVVKHLRRGGIGPRFTTIVLNGHSMGGLVAEHTAAHGDVDAVIISGIPAERPTGDRVLQDGRPDDLYPFYPAEQDPKFAAQSWAPGYLTTRPGTRTKAFLYEGTYDPAILPVEETLKDTLTIAELRTVRPPTDREPDEADTTVNSTASVPTAYALGRHDIIACETADCATDPAGSGADHIAADSGHSINTSIGAPRFYRWTFGWLARNGIRPHQPRPGEQLSVTGLNCAFQADQEAALDQEPPRPHRSSTEFAAW